MRPKFRPLAFLCALPACQAPQADTFPFTTTLPGTSEPGADTGVSTGNTSSGSSSGGSTSDASTTTGHPSTTSTGGDSGTTTLILDVGSDVDLGDGKPVGCKGKIDFLFVISRAGGMQYLQTQFLAAFPKFIDTIQEKFSDFDYHIMVVDGDPYWGLSTCDEQCPTPGVAPCTVKDYPCDYTPSECDTRLGAGVVFPAGGLAENKPCPIDGGLRYMKKDQTDLETTFACVAHLGVSGASRMGETMAYAVAPWQNDVGGCNEGFLRKDALLMVTLITNSYDEEGGIPDSQEGTPATWTDAVRKAKHGDLESVVVLGIIPTEGPGCHEKDRLCKMLDLFPYALNRDSWQDDYGPYFDEASDLVATACADFIPPG